ARLDPSNVASDNARIAAADLAGQVGMRTWFLTLYLALLGSTALVGLTPTGARVPVGIAALVGAAVAAVMSREPRGRQAEPLSPAARRLAAGARGVPRPQALARLWAVFGVSAVLAVLFFADLFSPAPDANLAVNWIAILIFGVAAGWT